jgi:hypothetical protein
VVYDASIPDAELQTRSKDSSAIVIVLKPIPREPLIQQTHYVIDRFWNVDTDERQCPVFQAELTLSRNELVRVTNGSPYSRRTHAEHGVGLNLL